MSEDIHEAAARWHFAQQSDDMDWDGFTAWLEADARHRTAYDAIALLDARIEATRPQLTAELRSDTPSSRRARWRTASAVAAAAAAIAAGVAINLPRPDNAFAPSQTFTSQAGTVRTVQLEKGVSATLGAGSRLTRTASNGGLRLEGSAYFAIHHDPARLVTISVGDYRIRDIGTRFAINSAKDVVSVSVEEGSVALQSPSQPDEVRVSAGQEAMAEPGREIEVRSVRHSGIATWRNGRFAYDDTPLGLVVADIARYTGQPVEISGPAARRRFSGVIAPGDRETMVSTLAQLTELHADSDGQTIRLVDRTGG